LAAIGRCLKPDADQMNYLQRLVNTGVRRAARKTVQTIGPQTSRLSTMIQSAAVMIPGLAAGLLTLGWQMLECSEDPEQMLYVITAPPDSPEARALSDWQTR
jgi:hypothetical protein